MNELTRQQQRIFDFIRDYLEAENMPPTRAEIAEALGFRTANTAQAHLKALVRKGYLQLLPGRNRNIRLVNGNVSLNHGIPLIGRVAAGAPIMAVEHIERYYPCAELFDPRADFLLRVRGDSMRDASINDGDLLAVHKTPRAHSGAIVVARVDDEVTVKTLQLEINGADGNGSSVIRLLPANPDYSPIVVDSERQDFAIEGLAVGTIRQFTARETHDTR